jgi:hypothetical protein
MKMVKRWGVMTLVALLVLGTMGAARADDGVETETETTKELLSPGSYVPALEWADGLVQFVFFWGEIDDDLCAPEEVVPTTGGGMFGFGGSLAPTDVEPVECVQLNVEKNGHVNHGSMVSSFVHWLKVPENLERLPVEFQDMPKGQLVKQFAHEDFGKGFFDLEGISDVETADVEAEESDGHGQPTWVKDKKADKPAKGKNK